MSVYLTWLADAFRAAGLVVVEWQGWQTRAKSSGGYSDAGRPWCVMWHHTASSPSTSPESLARYTAETADAAPIANVDVERDGSIWLLAAGPTNTNGKGNAMTFTKGRVPADSMNSYAFGMEIVNDGVGEPYSQVQIDAAFIVSNIVNARLGNAPDDVATHWSYAPTRKIDPAVNSVVRGPWQPGSCSAAGTWDLADLRAECIRRATTRSQEDDMPHHRWRDTRYLNVFVEPQGATMSSTETDQYSDLPLVEEEHNAKLASACFRAWGVHGDTPSEVISAAEHGGFLLRG